MLPSATRTASASRTRSLSRLNTWPTNTPVNASSQTSQPDTHDSGPIWLALPFIVTDSHPLLLPVSRRTRVASLLTLNPLRFWRHFHRLGRACPGHRWWHSAATDGRDKPGHDGNGWFHSGRVGHGWRV